MQVLERPVTIRRLSSATGLLRCLDLPYMATLSCPKSKSNERGWFHASSVGELEVLWPVVEKWALAKSQREVVLTIFSASAERAVKRLSDDLIAKGVTVSFCGFSPWEGNWQTSIRTLRPDFLVTAKYEAWPELWSALRRENVPLFIIGATVRKSLSVVRSVCRILGEELPKLVLLPADDSSVPDLEASFPSASVFPCGEPRWDRVQARSADGNSRARELVEYVASAPRPWGIFGSAWEEDIMFWGRTLGASAGTVWIVPHKVDSEHVRKISELLKSAGLEPVRTSALTQELALNGKSGICLLVDEMGFLLELYSKADWAFVGGGYGKGVHSTIEPALHGIPIGIGPKGSGQFPEIRELQRTGQLKVLEDREALSVWAGDLTTFPHPSVELWKSQAQARLGATEKVIRILESFGP